MSRRRQTVLGARLRAMYDNVIREDVPEDFLALLASADLRAGATDARKDADAPAPLARPDKDPAT